MATVEEWKEIQKRVGALRVARTCCTLCEELLQAEIWLASLLREICPDVELQLRDAVRASNKRFEQKEGDSTFP